MNMNTALTMVDEFVPVQARMAVFFVVREIKNICAQILHMAEFIFCGTKARVLRVNTSTAVRTRMRGGEHN